MEAKVPLSFFSNKNINIYPSSTFISDQVIYQWKEKKTMQIGMKTQKILKSVWFIPNFSRGLCWEAKFKSKSDSQTSSQLLCWKQTEFGILHFFSSPPTKPKCHGQGANSLQLGFYLPSPDASAKTGDQFQWTMSRTVCAMTNVCKTHTGLLSPASEPQSKS